MTTQLTESIRTCVESITIALEYIEGGGPVVRNIHANILLSIATELLAEAKELVAINPPIKK